MLIEAVAAFFALALFLYCLLAGADFGAGMIDWSLRRERPREVIADAIAPVWEANHVWLILAIVILFNGFPPAFAAACTTYHIPLTVMLLGVILRGCAFTFRYYDVKHDASQKIYGAIFRLGSVLTPGLLGGIAGAALLHRDGALEPTFFGRYVAPWCNLFALSTGLFTCALFAFLAAVYLIGETDDASLRRAFVQRARRANLAAIAFGLSVFFTAELQGFPLVTLFFEHPLARLAVILATALLAPLWWALRRRLVWRARLLAALQVGLVLMGFSALQYPRLIVAADGTTLTLYNSAAPTAVLRALLLALCGGSALIFPALYVLWRVVKAPR